MDKELKRIIIVLSGICLLFVVLIVYLSCFQMFKAEKVAKNSYNKRLWINEEKVLRLHYRYRNGKILAIVKKVEIPTIDFTIMEIFIAIL